MAVNQPLGLSAEIFSGRQRPKTTKNELGILPPLTLRHQLTVPRAFMAVYMVYHYASRHNYGFFVELAGHFHGKPRIHGNS